MICGCSSIGQNSEQSCDFSFLSSWFELVSCDTVFLSHDKSALARLSAVETNNFFFMSDGYHQLECSTDKMTGNTSINRPPHVYFGRFDHDRPLFSGGKLVLSQTSLSDARSALPAGESSSQSATLRASPSLVHTRFFSEAASLCCACAAAGDAASELKQRPGASVRAGEG